ncbi:MAG TPA: hypothetical protein ENF54_03880 [Desulfobacteraceae bacterium]|nr:hypothetical protein [Desulfobacteraceae bacterium]
MKRTALLISLFFLILPLSLAYSEVINRIVAFVNDDIITLYELEDRLRQVSGYFPTKLKDMDKKAYINARKMLLEEMINERLTEQKIQELAIVVNDSEIDDAIERIKQINGWTQEDLLQRLKEERISYGKYRQRIGEDLKKVKLINREVKSKIIIKDSQIEKYYRAHRDEFMEEEEVELACIFLFPKSKGEGELKDLKEKAWFIYREIKEGKDFSKMAKRYSMGPGAEEGGKIGSFKVSHLDPVLKKAIEGLPKGEITEPIVAKQGIRIIKVLNRTGGQIKGLSDVRDKIMDILYRDEVKRRYNRWIEEVKKRSYIRVIF